MSGLQVMPALSAEKRSLENGRNEVCVALAPRSARTPALFLSSSHSIPLFSSLYFVPFAFSLSLYSPDRNIGEGRVSAFDQLIIFFYAHPVIILRTAANERTRIMI